MQRFEAVMNVFSQDYVIIMLMMLMEDEPIHKINNNDFIIYDQSCVASKVVYIVCNT